jgi:hypothetical protein
VSELLRGRLDGFSTDRLLRFITSLGYNVQISPLARAQANFRENLVG